MSGCTAQPVSWLELERHALGELGAERTAGVDAHLQACPVCRGCMEQIRGDVRELPRLVVPATPLRRPWWNRWRLSFALAGAALAAAVLLIILLPRGGEGDPVASLPPPRLHLKGGGEVMVELVRDRGGSIAHDPRGFRDGDRFQAMVTCAFAGEVQAELIIFDRGQAYFPGPRETLGCGNRVVFPSAFALTGPAAAPVTVCMSFAAVDRARVQAVTDLPRATTGCIRLAPE